ncbi:type II toxin-antitoxin system RelE/ParE family toxin [Kaistella sp.]|uniref:type II toxin-antitoxin system RelE/ParE family toxin n=1 Tax=Kaistella sp. TaxID=2782235 RepID=UPI002F95862F
MKIEYKTHKLKKSFSDSRAIAKSYGTRAKNVKKRLEELIAAPHLMDISMLPQANLHELKTPRKGEFAVDISANYRITFVPANDPIPLKEDGGLDLQRITEIKINSVEDYH